jgi:antitoxin (DNA-binding transcriptional repressor) of toxin-antitoxin stability system
MIRATISETKNKLSSLLEKVREGETVFILDRDTPIAKIEPLHEEKEERLAALYKKGIIKPPINVPEMLPPLIKNKDSILDNFLEDRRMDR